MLPQTTNMLTRSLDDPGFNFESAGALGFANEYSGHAVSSATILPSQNPGMHGPEDSGNKLWGMPWDLIKHLQPSWA
jgi:hypothetical protein